MNQQEQWVSIWMELDSKGYSRLAYVRPVWGCGTLGVLHPQTIGAKMADMVTLKCEIGLHEWQRPAQRGRKPKNCPDHQPPKQEKQFKVLRPTEDGEGVIELESNRTTAEDRVDNLMMMLKSRSALLSQQKDKW